MSIESAMIFQPQTTEKNPFEGISGIRPATEIQADSRLKIAIVGKTKTGKSWMAATAPTPVLVYDFDGRSESLQGKEGVMIKTLIDIDSNKPRAIAEVEADLSTLKWAKQQGNAVPATYVFDSITYMKKYMEYELIKQEASFGRKIKTSINKSFNVAQGWDVINGVRAYLEYVLNEFSQLGNVIFVFHQRDEKDRDKSTKTETAYTGRQTVDPQYLETVLALFNEVYYIEVDWSGNYSVQCRPNGEFGASTTLMIDEREAPSIAKILAKHRENVAKKQLK
jgi:AAA domain